MMKFWLRSRIGLIAPALLLAGAAVLWCGRDRTSDAGTAANDARTHLKSHHERRSRAEARKAVQREARVLARGQDKKNAADSTKKRQLTPAELEAEAKRKSLREMFARIAREEERFSEDDRNFLRVLEEAEQAQDIEFVADAAQAALSSDNVELRRASVESLATFGKSGIPELADFLNDPDPDVAALAVDRYELALQDVENDEEIAVYAKLATLSLKDPDQLSLMLSQIEMVSDELNAIQTLVDIIDEGGEEAVSAALDSYERYTGEEWRGLDAAEKWLQENYDPPQPDAESPEEDDATDEASEDGPQEDV